MNYLYSCVPSINEEFANQSEATDITDEEFLSQWKPRPFKWYHRIFQVFCFFAFLGPIRFMFSFVICFLSLSLTFLIRVTLNALGFPNFGKKICIRVANVGFRSLAFGFGNIWIHERGEFDKECRFIIANHTAFVDPYIILYLHDITCVMKKELSNNSILRHIFENVDPVYVDRSVQSGATKVIIEHASNPNLFPVLIYPEGTLTNGDILLDFHHSAFLTDFKVQPITVRYWMPLVPKDWNTYAWTNPSIIDYMWMMFSMPPSFIDLHYLPAMTKDKDGEGDFKKFSKKAQLVMANDLKVRACTRTSNEIFRKPSPKSTEEMSEKKKDQ